MKYIKAAHDDFSFQEDLNGLIFRCNSAPHSKIYYEADRLTFTGKIFAALKNKELVIDENSIICLESFAGSRREYTVSDLIKADIDCGSNLDYVIAALGEYMRRTVKDRAVDNKKANKQPQLAQENKIVKSIQVAYKEYTISSIGEGVVRIFNILTKKACVIKDVSGNYETYAKAVKNVQDATRIDFDEKASFTVGPNASYLLGHGLVVDVNNLENSVDLSTQNFKKYCGAHLSPDLFKLFNCFRYHIIMQAHSGAANLSGTRVTPQLVSQNNMFVMNHANDLPVRVVGSSQLYSLSLKNLNFHHDPVSGGFKVKRSVDRFSRKGIIPAISHSNKVCAKAFVDGLNLSDLSALSRLSVQTKRGGEYHNASFRIQKFCIANASENFSEWKIHCNSMLKEQEIIGLPSTLLRVIYCFVCVLEPDQNQQVSVRRSSVKRKGRGTLQGQGVFKHRALSCEVNTVASREDGTSYKVTSEKTL